ncbi:MAG TPA: hypothetical protein VH206_12640 [Xanthobacteraceae bacterium]|jgi:hypothetical protein|nr:hypothetical protein [Xanthobacteraceae bacterium]
MWQGHVFDVCERVSEAQAILHDTLHDRKMSPAAAVEKLQALLSEAGLLEAMYEIGYFPRKGATDRAPNYEPGPS